MLIFNIFNERSDVGGEDVVFELVSDVVSSDIGEVRSVTVSRQRFAIPILNRVVAFFSGIFSIYSFFKFFLLFWRQRPDIIHIHNIFPFISPSIFLAAKVLGIPSLYHTHNFHLTCPVGSHFRGARICNECVNSNGFESVRHNCRGNFFESVGYWLRFIIHRRLGFLLKLPTGVIVVSPFAKKKLKEAGVASEKIFVLPNGVEFRNKQEFHKKKKTSRPRILYVGRLTIDKGILDLVALAKRRHDWTFCLVGTGPMAEFISSMNLSNIELHGWTARSQLAKFHKEADVAVVPSWCYETFGLAAAEAMSAGLPTVVANHGGLADFAGGLNAVATYEPRDVNELEAKLAQLLSSDSVSRSFRANALTTIEEQYSLQVFSQNLMSIYQELLNKELG